MELVAGDFFRSVPAGADAHLMKHIIHDWDDEPAVRIVQACRRAASPWSKLLLLETIVPGPNEQSLAVLTDLEMLVLPGGTGAYSRTIPRVGGQSGVPA